MEIRVGLLGFGFMGHNHANRLQALEKEGKLKFVAVCDTNAQQLADAPEGLKVYHNMDELFSDRDINTVIIAIPNHLHKEAVIKAAEAELNILCEKPVAMNVGELDEMLDAVERNKVKFTVHQQRRWDKDFRTAKQVYDEKTLGNVYTIQSKLYGFNGNMHDWHIYPEYGGGMLFDWGVHLIDQMLWMVNAPIASVFADVRNVINQNVDDYFKIILKFKNGVTGEIELGTYFLNDKENWFEHHWYIAGDKGTYRADGFTPDGRICRTTRLLTNVPGKITMTAAGPTRSFGPPAEGLLVTEDVDTVETDHGMFFDNFIRALQGKEEFVVTKSQVKRVLSLMEAIRESAKTNQSIAFEEE